VHVRHVLTSYLYLCRLNISLFARIDVYSDPLKKVESGSWDEASAPVSATPEKGNWKVTAVCLGLRFVTMEEYRVYSPVFPV